MRPEFFSKVLKTTKNTQRFSAQGNEQPDMISVIDCSRPVDGNSTTVRTVSTRYRIRHCALISTPEESGRTLRPGSFVLRGEAKTSLPGFFFDSLIALFS